MVSKILLGYEETVWQKTSTKLAIILETNKTSFATLFIDTIELIKF